MGLPFLKHDVIQKLFLVECLHALNPRDVACFALRQHLESTNVHMIYLEHDTANLYGCSMCFVNQQNSLVIGIT